MEAQKRRTIKAGNEGAGGRGHMVSPAPLNACGCSDPSCPPGGAVASGLKHGTLRPHMYKTVRGEKDRYAGLFRLETVEPRSVPAQVEGL